MEERWDEGKAAALIGARVVIGVTYVGEEPPRHVQCHGTVLRVDKSSTIDIALAGARSGEVFALPPDTEVFYPAAPGAYRLRATGETVTDPDFTVTYEVHAAPGQRKGEATS